MRELKFRAWFNHGNTKEMLHDDAPGDCLVWKNQGQAIESVMQYTGLKDKNGREIYEGDILRAWQEDEYIPNRDSGGGIIDYDREGGFSQIGKVGFTGCSFDYCTIKTTGGKHEEIHAPIDWLNNYEVIGNIHDNPELLGDAK